MAKKIKKRAQNCVKEKGVAINLSPKTDTKSCNPTIKSVDEGISVTKEIKTCRHLVRGVNLDKLSGKIDSSGSIRCEVCCRAEAAERRGCKGKCKQGKKKAGASLDSKSDSKPIWVCLKCGEYTCGGVGLPTTSPCHAVEHARKTRHPLVVQFEKPQLCWCFRCNVLIQVDKIEKTDETSHVMLNVEKLVKGRSSEKSLVDIEDVSIGDGSVTSEIKSGSLSTSDSYGQGGYVVRGMVNLGNTCFFNSIMQNLLAMIKLRDSFLKIDAHIGPLISSLKKLFTETNPESGFKNIINPRSFFGCVCSKSPQFRGYQQHDSHELLLCLLDGLSTEELSGRKQNGSLKEDESSSNTLVDALFGGQISSTVICNECRHSSTVYEPFLDLSLPVPTKKPPPPQKAKQVSRTRKTKPPPKKGGKSRVKVNRDADPLPVQTVQSQSSSNESSCPDQSVSSVAGEMVASSGDSTVLGSEEINSKANKEELSPPNFVTVGESEQGQVLDSVANKTVDPSDDFAWLDYVEAETTVDEYDSIFQKEDAPEVQDSEKDIPLTVFPERTSCETSDPVCILQEDQNLGPDFSSSSKQEDEVPLQVQNSEVLLLPYKEEISSVREIIGRDGEDSSSVLGGGPEESEFVVFCGLFDEPELVAGPAPRPLSSGDVEAGTIVRNISESDPDEVDDTDSPVSVESCLVHFIKPDLLSDDNAWHCENCSKILQRQKKKAKEQARTLFDGNASGSHDESWHASNSCSFKVSSTGNGDIKNDKNIESCNNGELQSSYLHQACNEESSNSSAADSCNTRNVKRDAPMLGNDNSGSEECNVKETATESIRVKRDATKRVLIYKAPSVLTIHLKRFSQDARGRLSKLNGHVSLRETMDLRPYIDPRCINEEKYEFQLVGVVEHSGTMRGGHYVAYVRGGQRNREKVDSKESESSTWYHASDAYVREVSIDEVLRSEAYILFYERN